MDRSLALKLVTSPAENYQRHHLDLYAINRAGEAERLRALGAASVDSRYGPGADYVVLADPDGNRFCVIEVDARHAAYQCESFLAVRYAQGSQTTIKGCYIALSSKTLSETL